MKGVSKSFKRFAKPFMNSRLSTKLILGYIFIVLIPTLTLEVMYYNQNMNWVYDQYKMNEKSNLESAENVFLQKIQQVEPLTDVFQSNNNLLNYMEGGNASEGEELYSYIKDINPILSYTRSSIKIIGSIKIFKFKKTYLSLNSDILDMDKYKGYSGIIDSLGILEGKWVCGYTESTGITATYYKSIYSKGYVEKLGFAQIILKSEHLFDTFSNLGEKLYLVFDGSNQVLQYKGLDFAPVPSNDKDTIAALAALRGGAGAGSNAKLIDSMHLSKLGFSLVYMLGKKDKFTYQGTSIIIVMLFLLIILSILYYVIFTSISRRVIALDRHIACSPADALKPMLSDGYSDEIGSLTASYNSMIDRINNLIDRAYKAEILKKDAEFYALQAQVNPHFLYNILENIRMCAESNNDFQSSDMIFILVKYMRYNLSIGKRDSTLADEIEHIKNYLEIYKIRLGKKLKVTITQNTEIQDVYCPRFILQPIVENSIKHGLKDKKGGTVGITVDSQVETGDVTVGITDNGQGISPEDLNSIREYLAQGKLENDSSGSRIGLGNVNERLILCYGSEYGLSIASEPGKGTTVILALKRGYHLK